jgi:hypothetical protein
MTKLDQTFVDLIAESPHEHMKKACLDYSRKIMVCETCGNLESRAVGWESCDIIDRFYSAEHCEPAIKSELTKIFGCNQWIYHR